MNKLEKATQKLEHIRNEREATQKRRLQNNGYNYVY